ncbi:hypothetical protein KDL29_03050 [bacterium]|nr:hypothetical protein [bacterium]UNM09803.1 MAG: hypothetical protein H7A35_07015 [Planctomycetales bacterium]
MEDKATVEQLQQRVEQLEAQVAGLLESNRNIVDALRQIESWIVNASKVLTAQIQQQGSGEQGQ